MKFGNLCIILFLTLSAIQTGDAQVITKNENGEKIIVYPDGSFKFAEDVDLENLDQAGVEANSENKVEIDKDLEIAIRIAEMAAAEEAEAIRKVEDAQYNRLVIEDELKDAEESEDYFEEEIQEIRDRLKKAKKLEKKAKSNKKQAVKKAKKAEGLLAMGKADRAQALKKYDLYHTILKQEAIADANESQEDLGMFPSETPTNDEPQFEEMEEVAEISNETSSVSSNSFNPINNRPVTLAKYDFNKDVLYNPPGSECQLTFEGIDEFSGKKRKDVAKQLLFNYTNEELRQVYRGRDYMTCYGYLSSLSGGIKFLTLNITIASKTAQREYGILEKGASINVKLLNGDNVKMTNSKTNMGTQNPLDGSYTYRGQYIVSSGDEKKLKKSEVDKLRITWSSGYEDYEIYEMDFFIDQFKCLNEK